jgi:hypothetical protein
MTDRLENMFGCKDWGLIKAQIIEDAGNDPKSLIMTAMGILSDAQEVLAMGDAELSRQMMNRAKSLLSSSRDAIDESNKSATEYHASKKIYF